MSFFGLRGLGCQGLGVAEMFNFPVFICCANLQVQEKFASASLTPEEAADRLLKEVCVTVLDLLCLLRRNAVRACSLPVVLQVTVAVYRTF